jgi:PAS domain-containing protein
VVTSSVALVVACVALATYEQMNIRHRLINDLATTAAMTGANSTAGLTFNDPAAVEQTLKSLAAQPRIVRACVYGKDARPFALYQRSTESRSLLSPPAQPAGHRFTGVSLELFQPITLDGETLGTIFLEPIWKKSARASGVMSSCWPPCSLAARWSPCFVAARLQRIISHPIADLAQTAARVATERDYSVRAHKQSDDELGKLTDGFNHMLAQIQTQDAALQKSHQELERRVQDRTAQLADSLSLTRATLEATTDAILVADGHGKVTGFNENFLAIWNIPRELSRDGHEAAMLEIAMKQLRHPDRFRLKVEELYQDLEAESFDVLEFNDGRVLERFSKPQRIGDACVGRVWSFRDVTERKRSKPPWQNSIKTCSKRRAARAWPKWPPACCTTSATCSTASTSLPPVSRSRLRKSKAPNRCRGSPSCYAPMKPIWSIFLPLIPRRGNCPAIWRSWLNT